MVDRKALVAGATGLVGRHCVELLLEDESYSKVTVLVRRPFPVLHEKLNSYVIDFDDPDSYNQMGAVDDIFCCLGTTIKKARSQSAFRKVDHDYTVRLAEQAYKNGAVSFSLVSSLGADPHSRIFYNRVKGEVEEAIKKISFRAIFIYRPSMLLGNREEFRLGEHAGKILIKAINPVLRGTFSKYRGIQASDVARAMIRTAQRDLHGIQFFESNSIADVDSD